MFVFETDAVRSITFFVSKCGATMAVFSAYNFFAERRQRTTLMVWVTDNSVHFQIVKRGKIQPRFCAPKIQGGIDQCRTYDFAEQSVNSGNK